MALTLTWVKRHSNSFRKTINLFYAFSHHSSIRFFELLLGVKKQKIIDSLMLVLEDECKGSSH